MIVETAPAKLNLALHVRHRRDDGYHELETLFAFAAEGDVITIVRSVRDRFSLTGPFASALSDTGDNLVLRARNLFRSELGSTGPVDIVLDKRLPVASGIGGGSADAAATLRALADLNGVDRTDPRLLGVAAALGSDVPACLVGRTLVGRGRGERLDIIPGVGPVPILLVNPGTALSTAAVFAAWDGQDRGSLPEGNAWKIASEGRNDLEQAAAQLSPAVDAVLRRLTACPGTRLVRMSGSGATCFALFDAPSSCMAAAEAIRFEKPEWWCLETALT